MHGTPRKHIWSHRDFRKAISCAYIKQEEYSEEEFEVQSEIPALRRKIILDVSSSCSVSIMTPDRAWQGQIRIRTAKTYIEN